MMCFCFRQRVIVVLLECFEEVPVILLEQEQRYIVHCTSTSKYKYHCEVLHREAFIFVMAGERKIEDPWLELSFRMGLTNS